jgi:signal peptidase II
VSLPPQHDTPDASLQPVPPPPPKPKKPTPQQVGIVTAIVALIADQLSKNVLLYGVGFAEYGPHDRIEVLPFFDIIMVWNRGVSYGLFQAGGLWGTVALAAFSLLAVAALSWWLRGTETRVLGLGLGLIIGGALGNVIDRVIYGAVADFFHFYAFGHDWYVFNIADAAITLGVVALIVDAFVHREKNRDPAIRG